MATSDSSRSHTEPYGPHDNPNLPGWTPPPPEIPGYKVGELLGSGGMGEVWRARQLATHRDVALKVLRQDRPPTDKAMRRFRREMELASRLNHPRLAQVHDGGEAGGRLYYAMELVENGTRIDEFADARGLDPAARLDLMRDLCEAVGHAHSRGVLHRDIKPSNVLIDAAGAIKVIDFGLAEVHRDDPSSEVSHTVIPGGTPGYMSPEQARGERGLSPASDVFGLGCLLYRLLAGELPWDAADGPQAVLRQIQHAVPRLPAPVRAQVPSDLRAVLEKALEKSPDHRYADAGELAEDLAAVLEHRPISFRARAPIHVARKWLRRHRRSLAVLGLAAAVLGVGVTAAWIGWRSRPDPDARLTLAGLPETLTLSENAVLDFAPGRDPSGAEVVILREPVPVGAWKAASLALPEGSALDDEAPLTGATFEQTRWFCDWLNQRVEVGEGMAFRLPAPAEAMEVREVRSPADSGSGAGWKPAFRHRLEGGATDGATDGAAGCAAEWTRRRLPDGAVVPALLAELGRSTGMTEPGGTPRTTWMEFPDTQWDGAVFRVVYGPVPPTHGVAAPPPVEVFALDAPTIRLPLGAGQELTLVRVAGPSLFTNRMREVIELTYPYWLAATETTLGQWAAIRGERRDPGQSALMPVRMVARADAMAWCAEVDARSRGVLPEGYAVRLPTSMEWERPCNQGNPRPFAPGVYHDFGTYANAAHPENADPGPLPVGSRRMSDWGFFDMNGNLGEWVRDDYEEPWDGPYPDDFVRGRLVDPVWLREGGEHAEFRGGYWSLGKGKCGCRRRNLKTLRAAYPKIGFRVAVGPSLDRLNNVHAGGGE